MYLTFTLDSCDRFIYMKVLLCNVAYVGYREVCDLSSVVSDLQLQNRRLTEENTKLREQLTSNEEMSSNVILELEELRDTVKK